MKRYIIIISILILVILYTMVEVQLSSFEIDANLKPPLPFDEQVVFVDPVPHKQLQMDTGRLSQTPVSWYYFTNITSDSGLSLRTVCTGTADTGMIVRTNGKTYFNDNSIKALGNNKGSYLSLDTQIQSQYSDRVNYEIFVFSMKRATSKCRLDMSLDKDVTWSMLAEDHFGGTLVDVGPIHNGDYLEIQNESVDDVQRIDNYLTRMLLFDPDNRDHISIYSNSGSSDNNRPRIDISNSLWLKNSSRLLIGKQNRSRESNSGVEVRVDLVHGPLNTNSAEIPLNINSNTENSTVPLGNWRQLQPGRYYVRVYAKTSSPVGSTATVSNPPHDLNDWECASDLDRGQLDVPAFQMILKRRDGGAQTRSIRVANMGAAENEFNVFILPLSIKVAGEYTMSVITERNDIEFLNVWRLERNPDASEFTAVTYNTLYNSFSKTEIPGGPGNTIITFFGRSFELRFHQHESKILNTSNLLATRGIINKSELSIKEPADQAPYEWDADVIGLTELRKGGDDDRRYANLFTAEASRVGATGWSYVWGKDEEYTLSTDGAGPLFVSSVFYPNGTSSGIYFGQNAKDGANCSGGFDTMECELDPEGWDPFQTWNSIIGKMSVKRYGASPDRPIVVVNLHLKSDADNAIDRSEQIDDLIYILKRLMNFEPKAFNSAGDFNPKHYQNRIILMGDFNIGSHHCGEHYHILRKLRKHFGYAIDVSMAANDFDGHDEIGNLDNLIGHNEWVNGHNNWLDAQNANSDFPWWVMSHRKPKKSGLGRNERYDAIMLIGNGWAYDDPVVNYEVLHDRSTTTKMNPNGLAVEVWGESTLVDTGSPKGYRPNNRISLFPGDSITTPLLPGDPALDSDHIPIRARIRVYKR